MIALSGNTKADIGIGTLIIFIAMILVAGVVASVLIQTMNRLQQQAIKTSEETMRDVSSGLEVTHVSGYCISTAITQLAIFISPTAASDSVDLIYTYISLSNSSTRVILNYTTSCFNSSISSGLFGTMNSSLLTSTTYGILVIRDADGSCTSTKPSINERDIVVLLVNTTRCFSGIGSRVEVSGNVIPEYGMSGVIAFTTPPAFVDTILDLQP